MKAIHVVAALIRKGDEIFATQRGYGDLKGGWEFPGGKVQEGETPQEALVREIKEELDSEITVGRRFTTVEYDYSTFHLSMDCYWCSLIEGTLELKEHMNACWLKEESLDSVNWLPADQIIIDQMKEEGWMIRNLVFDVGNVLLSYRWKEMLVYDYGLNPEESERIGEAIFNHPSWVNRFDRGVATYEEMIEEYKQIYPEDERHIRWFFENGQKMRVPREEIWELVRRLKEEKGYRIYLLSNYSKYLFDLHSEGYPFLDYLDGQVISYEAKMVKPEPEIYHYLFDKYDLKAEECLFFDDRYENVTASHDQKMDANFITSREMLGQILKNLL